MQIHWLTVRVDAPAEIAVSFYNFFLRDKFGPARFSTGRYFYREGAHGLDGAAVYYHHVSGSAHFTMDLPGKACEAFLWSDFQRVAEWLENSGLDYEVTRLDVAFDDFPFTPLQFQELHESGRVTSLARRSAYHGETVRGVTTRTYEIGSRRSWLLRVYDRRGVNRSEMQFSHEHAHLLWLETVCSRRDINSSSLVAKGLFRRHFQIVDIPGGFRLSVPFSAWLGASWIPCGLIPDPVRRSFRTLESWLYNSAAPALAALELHQPGSITSLMSHGSRRLSFAVGRYQAFNNVARQYLDPFEPVCLPPAPSDECLIPFVSDASVFGFFDPAEWEEGVMLIDPFPD